MTRDEWLTALESIGREGVPDGETVKSLMARWRCTDITARRRVNALLSAGRAECVGTMPGDGRMGKAKVYRLIRK